MTGNAVKFTFDTAFDGGATERARAEKQRVEAAIAQARAEGEAHGHAAGHAQAMDEIEARTAGLMALLAQRLDNAAALQDAAEQAAQQAAAQMAHAIGKALCRHLTGRYPLAEIEALVAESFQLVRDEPRIVVRVADNLLDALKERLPSLSNGQGYGGKIVLIGDDRIAEGDCLVEWADGGLERNMNKIMTDIDRCVARFLETPGNQSGSSYHREEGKISHG